MKLSPSFGLSRSEEHTSELQSQSNLVCRLLLEKKNELYTFTPGATTSGLTSARTVEPIFGGPLDEKPARMSALGPSVKNSCWAVPSMRTVFVEAPAIASPFSLETIAAGVGGWFGGAAPPLPGGSPFALVDSTGPHAPACCAVPNTVV